MNRLYFTLAAEGLESLAIQGEDDSLSVSRENVKRIPGLEGLDLVWIHDALHYRFAVRIDCKPCTLGCGDLQD